jgi:XRE family transcriptional regulator, fatty acid utilization regulator
MMLVMDGLGARLRELRRARALTQEELAEKADVSPSTIVDIERGKHEPQIRTLRKLAKALETTPDKLVLGE